MAEAVLEDKLDQFTSQLSAHIWGHRFREGQRGPEYVLEFLNVLFGANYSFSNDEYRRKKSLGLRKFIFEGLKEGAGTQKFLVLEDEEKAKLLHAIEEDNLHVLRQFLRNLEVMLYNTTGKEADRSWFARSLYPLHESLLYVEMRKKGEHYSFERNFYARGGELYFLMIAFGTDKHQERRSFIETRMKQLLTKNKIIEKVVDKITLAFDEKDDFSDAAKLRSAAHDEHMPKMPQNADKENEQLFESFAEEMECLLSVDLDIYKMFHLLIPMVCFQLARYMHERSYIAGSSHPYFFDCMDGSSKPLSQLSSFSFEQHENLIKEKFEHVFESKVTDTFGSHEEIEQRLPQWKTDSEKFMEAMGLSQMRKRKKMIESVLFKCNNAMDVNVRLKRVIREAVSDQLKKTQLGITRVISRDGGFATYRRGSASNYRYTISDEFLEMLVFTMVKPKERMEYYEFLEALYQDYDIVIGEVQAKKSGLYEKSRLNIRYFNDNEKALRDKLRHNGLLIEFSDATAMVQNPYSSNELEVSYV